MSSTTRPARSSTWSGWWGRDYYDAFWGTHPDNGGDGIDQHYSIPQAYSKIRPPYYRELNDDIVGHSLGPISHSGIAWDCTKTYDPDDPDTASSYADSAGAFGHLYYGAYPDGAFDNGYARPPWWRVLVHDRGYLRC